MTRIDPDDPKWTAYVLGELDEQERAAIEAELASSEDARMLVEELRLAADMTRAELRDAVAVAPLSAEQRAKIQSSVKVVRPRRWFAPRLAVWATGLAAASIVLIAVVNSRQTEFSAPPPRQIAMLDAQKVDEAGPADTAGQDGARDAAAARPAAASGPQQSVARPEADTELDEARIDQPVIKAQIDPAVVTPEQKPVVTENSKIKQEAPARVLDGVLRPVESGAGDGAGAGVGAGRGVAEARQVQAFAAPPPPAPRAARIVSSELAPGVPSTAEFDRISRPPLYKVGESYDRINDNPFVPVGQDQVSTFSIDVDTASYSNVRRFLNQNQLPPRDAVRIEELINYFDYDYPQPANGNPVGAVIEAASAPWNPQHRLVRVAIKARDIDTRRRPASNLVFLIDVSGSMQPEERLPLLKNGLRMLVEQLTANDRVTIVTYAGTTGVALRPTRGDQKDTIISLIQSLQAGGSTNGASGIQLAYEQAAANFIQGGVNRVILATDGDFNVGITNRDALLRLIEEKAKTGVFLSVLGVGMGNYKDATLEMLADKGNGNFAYLDTLNEARKVLVDQMSATLVTRAKDVKVQVEFNPAVVDAYRLIGYENRALRNEDFNDDLKDAGEMGAGQTVTVLYEVVPRGVAINAPRVDSLRYETRPSVPPPPNASKETLNVKIRYKEPAGADSKLLEFPLIDGSQTFARASMDFRFAASVAGFGMILRDSPHKGSATMDSILGIAEDSMGSDRSGYRREFLQLVQRARQLRRQ